MMPAKKNNWLPGIFNDFFGNEWMEKFTGSSPAVNIMENDERYTVEVAAPGLTKEDFKVNIHDGNNLVVTMEKKSEDNQEDKENKYLRREFSYTSFQQTMVLPENIENERIEAKVENGVLKIEIPKKKEIEPVKTTTQIDIK